MPSRQDCPEWGQKEQQTSAQCFAVQKSHHSHSSSAHARQRAQKNCQFTVDYPETAADNRQLVIDLPIEVPEVGDSPSAVGVKSPAVPLKRSHVPDGSPCLIEPSRRVWDTPPLRPAPSPRAPRYPRHGPARRASTVPTPSDATPCHATLLPCTTPRHPTHLVTQLPPHPPAGAPFADRWDEGDPPPLRHFGATPYTSGLEQGATNPERDLIVMGSSETEGGYRGAGGGGGLMPSQFGHGRFGGSKAKE